MHEDSSVALSLKPLFLKCTGHKQLLATLLTVPNLSVN
jgi:hypothetical protein